MSDRQHDSDNNRARRPVDGPRHVERRDLRTRLTIARTIFLAHFGTTGHLLSLLAFGPLAFIGWQTAWLLLPPPPGSGLTGWPLGIACAALPTLGLIVYPLLIGLSVLGGKHVAYYDNGRARAAMALGRPARGRPALPGDLQGYSFGAWPKRRGAGKVLAEWVLDDIHASGGRLLGTAFPNRAKTYTDRGMVEDGRTAGYLVRVASKPAPPPLRPAESGPT